MNLEAAKDFLGARLGLRFEGHAETRLRSALQRRLAAAGSPGLADYLARLWDDDTELKALASLLTVRESYFFREPQHLGLLTEHLAPALLRERAADAPVRILSAGCAGGEEPYSIAMALRERWGESAARRFRIAAVDLDPEALAQARTGRYRPWSLRGLDPARAARWFSAAADGTHELAPDLRQAVAFRTLNLVSDPLPADLGGQDLIFYRNLSIYFDATTREAVLRRLRTLLCAGGYLIVGIAETLANGFGLFRLCEQGGVWYFRHQGTEGVPIPERILGSGLAAEVSAAAGAIPAPGARPDLRPPGPTSGPPPTPALLPRDATAAGVRGPGPGPGPASADRYREARDLAASGRFAAAAAVLAPVCAGPEAPADHLLLAAHLLAEAGDPQGAGLAARRVLAVDPWSVEAEVLLGRLARLHGDLEAAALHLRRAVYASPDHWPAHFELAECRTAAGQEAAARREYQIVLRLLGQAGTATAGPLPARLPVADLRHLCRARLARLGDAA